jgi:hypothetical protein
MEWIKDQLAQGRRLFAQHWVTIIIVVVVISLVVAAKVISGSSSSPQASTPSTQPPVSTVPTTHPTANPTTTPTKPGTPTTKPTTPPTSIPTARTTPQKYIAPSKQTLDQRKAGIAVELAFLQTRALTPKLFNAALTRQLTRPPTPAGTTLTHGLGAYPGHPQVIQLNVKGTQICYEAGPTNTVPPRPIVCP